MLYVAVVFIWQARLVIKAENSKRKGVALFVFYTASPVALSGALFVSMLGYEMLTGNIVMSESFARELIFATAIGTVIVLISTLIFTFFIFLIKTGGKQAS